MHYKPKFEFSTVIAPGFPDKAKTSVDNSKGLGYLLLVCVFLNRNNKGEKKEKDTIKMNWNHLFLMVSVWILLIKIMIE